MGYSAGAHETLEILDGVLYSSDHPEQSSAVQCRAKASKVVRCSVKCWIRLPRAKDYLRLTTRGKSYLKSAYAFRVTGKLAHFSKISAIS